MEKYQVKEWSYKGEQKFVVADMTNPEKPVYRFGLFANDPTGLPLVYYRKQEDAQAEANRLNKQTQGIYRLLDLDPTAFLLVAYQNKAYTEAIDEAINTYANYDFEEFITNYLDGCANYSFGLYCANYLHIQDPDRFFEAMTDKVKEIATSEKVIKAVEKCQKLKDANSNLFAYTVENELKNALADEAQQIASYYEDLSYQVYCKATNSDKLTDFVATNILEIEDGNFEGLEINLNTGEVYQTRPSATIPTDQLEAIRQAVAAA